ncbi:hypothetical protein EII34_14510 [Arachnia propionica]|uniref:SDR-like Ig domain-containing protein n=1 Tax=Arachnia propionica TaxID=1750 RepID=A0A3P1T1J7_9ACTN|nr:Ig-like domain-containing protein [Arachnia propionica]RRD03332.1 hypothetical protein EII34_14510 [Arachnia propionica]
MKKPKVLTRGRKVLFALLAAVIAAGGNLQATPAHAAEVNAINADTISITNETRPGQAILVNDTVRIEASWSIPDGTGHDGDTFSLGLPVNALEGKVGSFNLTPEGQDAPVYGTCEIQKTQILCTLSAEAENKSNVRGKLWFTSRAHQEYNNSNLTFTVNGNTPKEVPLPNGAEGIGYDPYTPQELDKLGYFIDDDTLTWRVIVPGKALADRSQLTINDTYAMPGTNFTIEGAWFYKIPNTPKCWNNLYDGECRTELWSKEGAATDGVNVAFDDTKDTINVTVGAPFQIQEDKLYTLHIDLKVDGTVVPGSQFENVAIINGQAIKGDATKEAAGGGTGDGDAVGHIQLVKKLTGNHSVPADTVFPVEFSFQRAGQQVTGTLPLKADGTPQVLRNIVNGTVVTFTEGLPTVAGNTFGDPVFSGEGVADGGAASASATVTAQGTKTLEVTLTNPVEPPPALEQVTPVDPTITEGVCTPGSLERANPTVQVANTEGITYGAPQVTVQGNQATITVTATPENGKQLVDPLPAGWVKNPDGTSATFTKTIDHPACPATTVIPVDPTFEVGTCRPGEVEPSDPTITAATTEGITYSASWAIDNNEVVFTATATAKPGYEIDRANLTDGWTWNNEKGIAEFTKRVPKNVCVKTVVPAVPKVTAGVCRDGATVPTDPVVDLPATEGITYRDPQFAKEGRNVTVTVVAEREDGYIIDGGNLPQGWVYNNDGTATYTTTVEQPECTPVTPVAPTITPGVCTPGSLERANPTVEVATTEGITYGEPKITVQGGKATITVTATPVGDKQLIATLPEGWVKNPDGTSATYTKEIDHPACEATKVIPVSPKVQPGACTPGSTTPADPSVAITPTEGITYGDPQFAKDGRNVTVTVTATANQAYAIDGDKLTEGWKLNPDGTATYTIVVEQPVCELPTVTPVDPTVTPGVCTPGSLERSEPTVEVATTEGITYGKPQITTHGGKAIITVTATPEDGKQLVDALPEGWVKDPANNSAVYTKILDHPACEATTVVPVAPAVTPGVCTPGSTTPTDPSVELPTTEGITYGKPEFTVEGRKVTVKVIATVKDEAYAIDGDKLAEGWKLNADGTATYTTTVEQPACEVPAPPAPVEPVKPVDPKITPGVCKPGSKTPTPPRVQLPKVPGLVYGTPMMTVVGNKVTVTVTVVPEAGKKIGELGKGWTLNQNGSATYTYTGTNPVCGKPGMPKTGN